MASRRPLVSSQLPLSFSAVFLPIPGQSMRSDTASGESKTSNVLAPKWLTSLPAVTLPTPGRAPPARYRRMASSSCGTTSMGVADSWNCMPHLSTSRHSPHISRNCPSATPGMLPTTVTTLSALAPFLLLRCLYFGMLLFCVAVAPMGSWSTWDLDTRSLATVHWLSGLWKVTRRISPLRVSPLGGAGVCVWRGGGGGGRSTPSASSPHSSTTGPPLFVDPFAPPF